MDWIISANGKKYDHANAFKKWGFIDWHQAHRHYEIGDIIYIYCTNPIKKVMYKTKVEKINLTYDKIVDDFEFWYDKTKYQESKSGKYARLRLIEQADREELELAKLKEYGLKAAPQGAFKVPKKLKEYLDKYLFDTFHENIFPDSDVDSTHIEGAKTTVFVNRYERSSIARNKCIEHHGCYCHVCEINFQTTYGEVGKGFIHVHHIIPLSEIDKTYTVDYVNDLIPVCPNCHAMLHRKINGKYLSINELKSILSLKK